MKKIVLDSSAIILLSKCGLLETACAALDLFAPPSVILETASRDLARRYPDAALVRSLVERGVLKTERPPARKLFVSVSLHRGEEDALRLAMSMQNSVLATDDGKAIKAARFLKVPFVITPKIVVSLFRFHKISFSQARLSIEKLGTIGRYSPDIIAESILSLTEVKHGKAHNHKGSRRPLE